MGLSDSWILVRNTDKQVLWDAFDLEEAAHPPRSTGFGYIDLPNRWSVVWGGSDVFDETDELRHVSNLNFALRLHLHDKTELISTLTAAESGKILWEVSVRDDKLRTKGKPPRDFGPLRSLTKAFNGPMGDQYDIPMALAKAMTGFDDGVFFDTVRYLQPKPGSRLSPPSWPVRAYRILKFLIFPLWGEDGCLTEIWRMFRYLILGIIAYVLLVILNDIYDIEGNIIALFSG